MTKNKQLMTALNTVMDPQLHENIVDLGLIYGAEKNGNEAIITMTLTTPFCPMAPQIQADIEAAVLRLHGITNVTVLLVWEPVWDVSSMASDEIKDKLGLW